MSIIKYLVFVLLFYFFWQPLMAQEMDCIYKELFVPLAEVEFQQDRDYLLGVNRSKKGGVGIEVDFLGQSAIAPADIYVLREKVSSLNEKKELNQCLERLFDDNDGLALLISMRISYDRPVEPVICPGIELALSRYFASKNFKFFNLGYVYRHVID